MRRKLIFKLFSFVSALSVLFNSFYAPLYVLAQDQLEPTFTPVESLTTPATTDSLTTPTPAEDLTTPTPTEVPTTSTPTDNLMTPAPTSTPQLIDVDEPTPLVSPLGTVLGEASQITPTPSDNEITEGEKKLDVFVLENADAGDVENEILPDFDYRELSSATLTTDKFDYAPTDAVVMTGNGFLPNTKYELVITSQTGNFRFSDTVTSDESGALFYTYQLDGVYRPEYKVEVLQGGVVLASVSFTDDTAAGLPFFDSFGTTNNSNVTDWDGNYSEITGGSGEDTPRDSVFNPKFAKIGRSGNNDGYIRRTINATGYMGLVLKYYWKGDADAGGSDRGIVEYCLGSDCTSGFSKLVEHSLNNTSWNQNVVELPSSLNNTTFRIRFRNDANQNNEYFRVDDVEIYGYPSFSWPNSWQTPSCSTDPAGDESPDEVDIVGDVSNPAVGFSSDTNYQYFRERLDGDPGTFKEKAWVVLFQTSTPQYQYIVSLNGKDDKVQLWQNTSPSGSLTFNPILNDPAETKIWEGDSSLFARRVSAGGEKYFVDWAIPKSVLSGTGIDENTTKFFATSADANNFNKDHLNCYEQQPTPTPTPSPSPSPTPAPYCGDGVRNGQEECDGTDGVTQGQNFCTTTCKLVPIYDGDHSCPKETVRSQNPVLSKTISATDPNGETFSLTAGGKYLFEASGTFRPTSPAGWYSDAGYTTGDNWGSLVTQYGIQGTGDDYAAHALLADLGGGVGVVDWGDYNSDHTYTKYYEPTSGSVQFVISDRYGDWFNTSWQNQTGMSDNSGSLTLNVYECEQPYANISVKKSDNVDPVSLGDIITYTINWSISTNVGVNDVIIEELFASSPSSDLIDDNWVATNNPGWTSSNPYNYTYSLGDFPSGNHSGSVEIKLKVVSSKPAGVNLPANIENWVGINAKRANDEVSIGDSYTETTTVRPPVTIKAYKIVCNSEADLPNWGGTDGSGINANTAQNYVNASNGKCHLEPGWDFQWGFADKTGQQGVDKLIGTHIGPANGTPSSCASNCGPNTNTGTGYGDWKNFDTSTDASGVAQVQIYDLEGAPGIWVRENLKPGYVPFTYPPKGGTEDNVSAEIYCHNDRYKYDNYDLVDNPQYGSTYYCVAFNALNYGSIYGYKYDEDGKTGLNGWNIFIDENDNGQLDEGETAATTSNNEESDGYFEFTGLRAGDYSVCEVEQQGWQRMHPLGTNCQSVSIQSGIEQYIYFQNRKVILGLTLTKSNDATGTLSAGSQVNYTLVIKNTGNQNLTGVTIKDAPAGGFTYVAGSGQLGGNPIVPTISGGYLEWYVGVLGAGEEKTLTYKMQADTTLVAGTYPNVAIATGVYIPSEYVPEGPEETVFKPIIVEALAITEDSEAIPEGERIESNGGIPVNSEVKIAANLSYSTGVGSTGQVLGASTEVQGAVLPAAGSSTWNLIIALLSLLFGFGLKSLSTAVEENRINTKRIRKGIEKASIFLASLALFFVLSSSAKAFSDYVYITKLDSYLNKDNFYLSYSALSEDPITAQFYIRKEADATWRTLGSALTGASGQVEVKSSDIYGGDTKYFFKVVINGGTASDETSTIIDRSAPDPVSDYWKEKLGDGWYKLHWRNPNNSDYDRVKIYRSESKNFTADSSTEVATLWGTAGSEMSSEFAAAPGREYYFAIRAIDKAGNASGIVADPETQVTAGAVLGESTVATGTPKAEVVKLLPKEEKKGEVLGEEKGEEATPSPTQASEKKEQTGGVMGQAMKFAKDRTKLTILITLLLGLASYFASKLLIRKK